MTKSPNPSPARPSPARPSPTLRHPIVRAIFKRDLRSFFGSPAGYVFISIFALVSAFFLFNREFFNNNLASLDSLNEIFPLLLILFVPAVTMSIWAGERSQGTDELLLTLPASDAQVVLGKFLAAAGIYTITLAFLAPQIVILYFLGSPDSGLIFGNVLAFWLLGVTLIGAGLIGSQLSDNLTVAFILGVVFCAALIFAEQIVGWIYPPLARTWLLNFPVALFHELGRGILSLSTILLYAGLIVSLVYLNLVLLSRRHWRGVDGIHRVVRLFALFVITLSLTLLGANAAVRQDLTVERLHTLSDTTTEILGKLDPKRPVVVEAFISPESEVPKDYVQTRRDLLNLLRQYDAIGGSALKVRIVSTELYSEDARQAQKKYDIVAQRLNSEDEAGAREYRFFLALAFSNELEQVVIPFMYKKLPVEYELTRSIRTVSQKTRPRLGIVATDVQIMGGQGPRGPVPSWPIMEELRKQYEIVSVSPDGVAASIVTPEEGSDPPAEPARRYPVGLDVLLVPMASTLTQPQLDLLSAYVSEGNPTLILDDPDPAANPQVAPSEEKPNPQANQMMMFGGAPPAPDKGDITAFYERFGLGWDFSDLVWDPYMPHAEFRPYAKIPRFQFLFLGQDGAFDPEDPISSGLQEMMLINAGRILDARPEGSKLVTTALLVTGPKSGFLKYRSWIKKADEAFRSYLARTPESMRERNRASYVKDYAQQVQQAVVARLRRGDANHTTGELVTFEPARDFFGRTTMRETVNPRSSRNYVIRPQQTVAARTQGPLAEDAKPIDLILISDIDILHPWILALRAQDFEADKIDWQLDNVPFVLNCIDSLSGDESFLTLRKRRPIHRTLSRIEEENQQFEETWEKKVEEAELDAESEIARATTRFKASIQQVSQDETLDQQSKEIQIAAIEEAENRRLETVKARIEDRKQRALELADDDRNRAQQEIRRWYQSLGYFISPILSVLVGLGVLGIRVGRERSSVPASRTVGGQR